MFCALTLFHSYLLTWQKPPFGLPKADGTWLGPSGSAEVPYVSRRTIHMRDIRRLPQSVGSSLKFRWHSQFPLVSSSCVFVPAGFP